MITTDNAGMIFHFVMAKDIYKDEKFISFN